LGSAPQARAQTPLPNPALTASCGLDIVLIIDGSGSIDSTEYAQMQAALVEFVEAFLVDSVTPTQFALVELASGAVIRQAFTDNPTVMINEINEPRVQPSGQFTNWDGGLYEGRILLPNRSNPDLIVFTSDGNPNRRGGHTALGHSASIQTVTEANAMSWAIAEANAAKTAGTRVISIGIGNDLDVGNLEDVSSVDATITSNFEDLADDLADLAIELCAGTVTVHKVVDIDGNLGTTGDQGDGPAWTFSTNVDAPDSATPPSGNTDAGGLINFDIDLGANSMANLDVTEVLQPGFTFLSASCTDQNDVAAGTPGALAVNNIAIDANDIISCTFYNQAPDCSYLDDECLEGVWNFVADACVAVPVAGPCDDGEFCTTNDTCTAGVCGGAPNPCSDGVACTVDSCDEVNDQCVNTANHAACDNEAFCDGEEICDLQTGCVDGPDPDCNDGVACTVDTCDEDIDQCLNGINHGLCNNGQFCDGVEVCTLAGCQDGPDPVCNDGVACTVDACNEGSDQCDHVASNALCSNGFFCDGAETCNAMSGCVAGVPVACGDGVACTTDACNEATDSCDNTPNHAGCNNGLFCDGSEICDAQNGCVDGPNPNCSDGVVCTLDTCNEGTDTCDHAPTDSVCDDEQFCNGPETCTLAGCQAGTPPNCGDAVACTNDACNEATDTCDHVPDNTACTDGAFCTGVEICNPGTGCTPGSDPCPGAGTFCSEPLDQCVSCLTNADCANGVFCDGVETCNVGTGICQPGLPPNCADAVACTVDSCNEMTDSCDHVASDAVCSDGQFCNGVETCDTGAGCQAGTPPNCDDGVSCTGDVCNEIIDACVNSVNNAACDDGQFCNGTETCDADDGCQAGTGVDCSDGVPCTVDSCEEASDDCLHTGSDAACNDGQFCNGVEVCVDAGPQQGCFPGITVVCPDADGFACTSDVCDEAQDACVMGTNQCVCGNGIMEPGEGCDPSTSMEDCSNMADDDGDGRIDCRDTDCGDANGLPIETCGTDCLLDDACERILKDPGTITWGLDGAPDRFVVHGRFPMNSPIEPLSEGFAVRLSNAYGTIYESVLVDGDVGGRPGGRNFRYRDKSARVDGVGQRNGLYGVGIKIRMVSGVPHLSFKLTAYGDFSAATVARMTTQIVVGSNVGYLDAVWTQTSRGWKLPLSNF
jgi:hypothetical protein